MDKRKMPQAWRPAVLCLIHKKENKQNVTIQIILYYYLSNNLSL